MADKTLASLTAASALSTSDSFLVQQGSNSRKATLGQIKDAFDSGWALFADAATASQGNAVTINANTRTLLTIDAGTGSIATYNGNSGIAWANNAHTGTTLGASYTWRVTFRAQKSGGAAANILCELDIGAGGTPNIVVAQQQPLIADTVDHPITFNFTGYSLATFNANGGKFYITPSANIQVWQKSIFIRKDYTP